MAAPFGNGVTLFVHLDYDELMEDRSCLIFGGEKALMLALEALPPDVFLFLLFLSHFKTPINQRTTVGKRGTDLVFLSFRYDCYSTYLYLIVHNGIASKQANRVEEGTVGIGPDSTWRPSHLGWFLLPA